MNPKIFLYNSALSTQLPCFVSFEVNSTLDLFVFIFNLNWVSYWRDTKGHKLSSWQRWPRLIHHGTNESWSSMNDTFTVFFIKSVNLHLWGLVQKVTRAFLAEKKKWRKYQNKTFVNQTNHCKLAFISFLSLNWGSHSSLWMEGHIPLFGWRVTFLSLGGGSHSSLCMEGHIPFFAWRVTFLSLHGGSHSSLCMESHIPLFA